MFWHTEICTFLKANLPALPFSSSIDIFLTLLELYVNSTAITSTVITQMDQQIFDPNAGKNYNTAISAGDPHFEMEKINIHRSRPNRS